MKKDIAIVTVILALGLFGMHMLATINGWYATISYFDKYMHFLGGMFVFFALLMVRIPRKQSIGTVIFLVVFVGLLWEVYEYVIQYYTGAALATIPDSIDDLFFDTLGACIAASMFYFVRRAKKRYNINNAQR